ncbi:hypothetical protein AN641_05105 [Candidatus Epulonipiscioides gigas]|nr:hypothetical protein AN641_05105 [Epulopiscium sp. SCG-C07WGA-EpuloA2]
MSDVLQIILVVAVLVSILAFLYMYSKLDTFVKKFHLKWKDLEIDISTEQKNGSHRQKNRSKRKKNKKK